MNNKNDKPSIDFVSGQPTGSYSPPTTIHVPISANIQSGDPVYCDPDGQYYFNWSIPDAIFTNSSAENNPKQRIMETCPDCKGTGTYVGFNKTEICVRCNGNKVV